MKLKPAEEFEVPLVIEGSTLSKLCALSDDDAEKEWKCPVCEKTGTNSSRLIPHLLEKHAHIHRMLDLVEASVKFKSRGDTKAKLLGQIADLKEKTAVSKTTYSMGPKTHLDLVREGLTGAVIKGGLPLSVCEQDWPFEMIQKGMEIGYKAGRESKKGNNIAFAPSALALRPSRKVLTADVEKECKRIIKDGHSAMLDVARKYGCSQVSDGRSNTNNDALLVFAVQSGAAFLPLGAHNAGAEKKDTEYLAERSLDYLKKFPELAAHTFGIVSDGAPACLNAIEQVSETEYLVPVRCQSHALSLLCKAIAKGPFADCVDKAVQIITWIRGRPRINSLVEDNSGKKVFRVVEIRFATHVTAITRLLQLKMTLKGLSDDDKYVRYKAEQAPKVREEFKRMESILDDKDFWLEAKMFCAVSTPVVEGLRVLDRSAARAKDVNTIWLAIGHRLGKVFEEMDAEAMSPEKKLEVFKLYQRHRATAHRPAFDAADVLNPVHLKAIRAHVSSAMHGDAQRLEWSRLKNNARRVLEIVVKRRTLVDMREERARESAKRRKLAGGEASSAAPPDVPTEDFDAAFASRWAEVEKEFRDYYAGEGLYADVNLESEEDWISTDGVLKFYAIRILNLACTISDVERLHKVYSGIHTPARNRLLDSRVDDIALARLILRIKETERMSASRVSEDEVKRIATLSWENAASAIVSWGESLLAAITSVARDLRQTSDQIEVSGAVVAPEAPGIDDQEPAFTTLEAEIDEERLWENDAEGDGPIPVEEDLGVLPAPPTLRTLQVEVSNQEDQVVPGLLLFLPLFSSSG